MTNQIDIEAYKAAELLIAQTHNDMNAEGLRAVECKKQLRQQLKLFLGEHPVVLHSVERERIMKNAYSALGASEVVMSRDLLIGDLISKVAEVCWALRISPEAMKFAIGTADKNDGPAS